MKTRDQIFEEILKDQVVTDAVLECSRVFKDVEDIRWAFPHYFRVAAALGDVVNRLDLPGANAPESAEGIARVIPFITIGMPGMYDQFTAHWGDYFLIQNGVDQMFFEEEGIKARELGEAGEPNYLHGLLILDVIGNTFAQLAGTSLMIAAALNLDNGLAEVAGSSGAAGSLH